MGTFKEKFHDFWFEPAPATRLALLRICLGALIVSFLGPEYDSFIKIARHTDPRLFAPVGVVIHGIIPVGMLIWLQNATLLLAVMFTLGLWHRITGPLFSGLFLWLMCYTQSWSMIYHSDNLVVLHAIILGVTRSADVLSLDALFRDLRHPGAVKTERVGWEYNWPIKLMCSLVVCAYFLAATAKLTAPLGLQWATGQNLRWQMAVDGIRKELLGFRPNPLSYAIYDKVALFTLLAGGSLCLEFFAPLALFNRRFGWIWSINAFMMHWGILAVMHITFHYQLSGVMFLGFFPVERVLDWRRRPSLRPAEQEVEEAVPARAAVRVPEAGVAHGTLFYDGECGLCDRFVQFVLRRDRREYFQFATLQSEDGRSQVAKMDPSDMDLQTMVLVEAGRPYTRSTAALRICRRLAAPWPLMYGFMAIPKPLRDGVYSFVAARRKRWFKPPEACPVLPPELRRRFLS